MHTLLGNDVSVWPILCLAAYFNDIAVGAVCCRVDHSQNQKRLYIMTLGCLAPYRRLGIGIKFCCLYETRSGPHCIARFNVMFVMLDLFFKTLSPSLARYKDAESCAKHLWEGRHVWQHLPVSLYSSRKAQSIYLLCWFVWSNHTSLLNHWNPFSKVTFSPSLTDITNQNYFFCPQQSCADQQWVGHRLLSEVWLWDHRDEKELLQEDRACRCPRAAEEPAQPLCAPRWRAAEVRVGGTAFCKSMAVPTSTETELWQMPQGRHIQHFLQRTLKRKKKFKVQKGCIILFYFLQLVSLILHLILFPPLLI